MIFPIVCSNRYSFWFLCSILAAAFLHGGNRVELAKDIYYPISALKLESAEKRSDIPDFYVLEIQFPDLIEKHKSFLSADKIPLFDATALRNMLREMVTYFNDLGYAGVLIGPHKEDINARTGEDYRPKGNTQLRLGALFSQIGGIEVSLKRMNDDLESQSFDFLQKIKEKSPLNAGDLLMPEIINEYITRLSSHPGRLVNSVVDRSSKLGMLNVEYIVIEEREKPWMIYSQYGNSGTKSTGEWVSRAGFQHNQLTHFDDILTLDFVSADFGKTKNAQFSYERPIIYPDYLKFQIGASWSDYKGQSNQTTTVDFDGSSWGIFGKINSRPFLPWGWLLDFNFQLSASGIESNSSTLSQYGDATLIKPSVGISLQKPGSLDQLKFSANLSTNISTIGNNQLLSLGRTEAEDQPIILDVSFHRSLLLEQIIFGKAWKSDVNKKRFHYAHEFSLSLNGRWTFSEDRLIPQEQWTLGGNSTIRGYNQSLVSGDSGFFSNWQYHFYPYRVFMDNEKQKGQWSQNLWGNENWISSYRIFSDFGSIVNNSKSLGEENHTLWGAGLGVDLSLYKLMSTQIDIATPLLELNSGSDSISDTEFGDLHFYFTSSLFY